MKYWHTVKYLKSRQIIFRIIRHLYKSKLTFMNSPMYRERDDYWVSPITSPQSVFPNNVFLFLGEKRALSDIGWNGSECSRLWRYNQHYFADLSAKGHDDRVVFHQNLIDDWINNNEPTKGTGWEPYPTSLRIVNWIKWSLSGNNFSLKINDSLFNQAEWLSKNLEWHILGNHLFANAKALIFSGLWFSGPKADKWLGIGWKILDDQILEQILKDGGHFERSTMYHALAIEDILDLINITNCYASVLKKQDHIRIDEWKKIVILMQNWLEIMSHPDGEISFFNDAAIGIAPNSEKIQKYAQALDIPTHKKPNYLEDLKSSGYVRLANKFAVLLADVAPIGPDYLPGHAHADTLSFELSLFGKRLIGNSGTSVYGMSLERSRQRSTSAHSTILVDNQDSSEVWGGFRVARRAKIIHSKILETVNGLSLEASHDGYKKLHGKPVHKRSWLLKENHLRISDNVSGFGDHNIEVIFFINPKWTPKITSTSTILINSDDGDQCEMVIEDIQKSTFRLLKSTWHPMFGVSKPCWKISLTLSGNLPLTQNTKICWSDK